MRKATPASDPPKELTYDVAVIGKAVKILEELVSARELGLSDLALRAGTSKGAAFRILSTLEKRGYIDKDRTTKHYRAGAGLFALSRAVLASDDLTSLARPVLETLRDGFGETVNLAVMSAGQVLYMDVLESPQELRTTGFVGRRDALHSTALGKAMLATLDPAEARGLLNSYERRRHTSRTTTSLAALVEQLEAARERGYAIDDGENVEGVRCVAAAVLDARSRPIAAVSISGPASRIGDQVVVQLGNGLRAAVADIARRLAGPVDLVPTLFRPPL